MAIRAVNNSICGNFLCDKPASCKGLCRAHYAAKQRADSPDLIRERKRKWHQEHKAEMNAKSRQHYEDTKADRRSAHYRLFYNITVEEYERIRDFMRSHVKFRKLLNKEGTPRSYQREAVEHRHKDGLIRGAMAVMLNRAYGLIERLYGEDTADVLEALAEFHRNPPAEQALGQKVYGLIGKAQKKKKMLYGPDGSPEPQPRVVPAVTFEDIRRGK